MFQPPRMTPTGSAGPSVCASVHLPDSAMRAGFVHRSAWRSAGHFRHLALQMSFLFLHLCTLTAIGSLSGGDQMSAPHFTLRFRYEESVLCRTTAWQQSKPSVSLCPSPSSNPSYLQNHEQNAARHCPPACCYLFLMINCSKCDT